MVQSVVIILEVGVMTIIDHIYNATIGWLTSIMLPTLQWETWMSLSRLYFMNPLPWSAFPQGQNNKDECIATEMLAQAAPTLSDLAVALVEDIFI
jgi:hypothetical protein